MISHLTLECIRCLNHLNIHPNPGFNLIVGDNGSGKSSVLEALYLLSQGRSFRTTQTSRMIQHEASALLVRAVLSDKTTLAMQKHRNGPSRLRVNNEKAGTQADLAAFLPLQLIHPDGYGLVTGPRKWRRQYIDWATFHVEPSFIHCWRRAERALKHRNAALRNNASNAEISSWDSELIEVAVLLDQLRASAFQQFFPLIKAKMVDFLGLDLAIDYFRGWDATIPLDELLSAELPRDRFLGYTRYGPHRADLLITLGGKPVVDVLSRGQVKLLVCALRLAQGEALRQYTGKSCIYMLDDFASELSHLNMEKVLKTLVDCRSQVFISALDETLYHRFTTEHQITFHVEHLEAGDIENVPRGTLCY